MNHRIASIAAALLLAGTTAVALVACTENGTGDTDSGSDTDPNTVTESVLETNPESTTLDESVGDTASESGILGETTGDTAGDTTGDTTPESETQGEKIPETQWVPDVSVAELDPIMQNIFAGNEVKNETVMFIDTTDVKTLLYPIDTIVSVTSYDGKKTYENGKDYIVEDGKLKLVEGTSIPVITAAKYYNVSDATLKTLYNGSYVNTYWGEGNTMVKWQVNVNYTHTGTWEGYTQESNLGVYESFLKKLENGEDVTIFFYGDSITVGANSSWYCNYEPYQYSYPILFTRALADLFDYTVHYEAHGLSHGAMAPVPSEDYVAGTRGTITYINTAVGGWSSQDGVTNVGNSVVSKIETLGCDLFVVAFGMNDAAVAPATTRSNIETIVNAVVKAAPDTSVLLVSTMVPNPNSSGWYGNQVNQESVLVKFAGRYTSEKGVPCAVACVTSVSQAVLEYKDFHDYAGNNINHPNDFFSRLYAQTLLQAVIGYENMK